jgi:tRNA(Ile2) C34 agmatinyltransferase TiaS
MDYFIGIDDTDNLESRGTGHLARMIAQVFGQDFQLHGVTRHQLLEDPRIPKTAKNSCAGILFSGGDYDLDEIASVVRELMMNDFQPGSDPGFCVAKQVPAELMAYGRLVQTQIVTQTLARSLAQMHNVYLEGLGGDQGGVIGALAAVGLAAIGDDGRYVLIGTVRELEGRQPIDAILDAGISEVRTMGGRLIDDGWVYADKMRPARRQGKPILFVSRDGDGWRPEKLN